MVGPEGGGCKVYFRGGLRGLPVLPGLRGYCDCGEVGVGEVEGGVGGQGYAERQRGLLVCGHSKPATMIRRF